MEGYRFGLNIGTNFVGWCVLGLDGDGRPCRVEAAGSRIFSQGRDNKTLATLAANRRDARTARRRRDRYLQRRRYLIRHLTEVGLFPEGARERLALQREDPLELRARAIREKISPYQIGRALFHINQRRGFRSNRKDKSKEVASGKISNSVCDLFENMRLMKAASGEQGLGKTVRAMKKLHENKNLTFGSFLWEERRKQGLPTRARTSADGRLYDVYPTREVLEDEFGKICGFQRQQRPALLTDEVVRRLREIIFNQRPLKPQEVGYCAHIRNEKRTFHAMPSFQIYRICQEVHGLEWSDESGRTRRVVDYPKARDEIVDLLRKTGNQIKFEKMKKVLWRMGVAEGGVKFNYETGKRKGLDGDDTSSRLVKMMGKRWWRWSRERQDGFVGLILDDEKSDDEVAGEMRLKYRLSKEVAEACLNVRLKDGTANLSLKAARLITDRMREKNIPLYEAVSEMAKEREDFVDPMGKIRGGGLLSHLPYYGEVFQDGRHIIPGDREEKDRHDERKYFGGVTNPTVHIALNQIRKVVNELIERFGRPASMAVELERALPLGAEKRRELERQQREGRARHDRLNQELRELNVAENALNRLRLRLWKELADGCCPFSGEEIALRDLFSSEVRIEHLIPFSQSLDDRYANKTLCFRGASRHKGRRTPFEAFGDGRDGYDWGEIYRRARNLPSGKRWRFQENAREIWRRDDGGFGGRHLNDTRHIARLTREYMQVVCPVEKIDIVTGRLTAFLRGHWGLNGVLSKGESDGEDDHRRHAVDAIVTGMATRPLIERVAAAAKQAEEDLEIDRLFAGKTIDPWDSFRQDVEKCVQRIIVSHKSKRTKQGKLHNETAYGFADHLGGEGWDSEKAYRVVHRKSVATLDQISEKFLRRIRSPRLREIFRKAYYAASKGGSGLRAFQSKARELGIRCLRVTERLKVIPIADKFNKPYKYYKSDNNWGMEIYAYPKRNLKKGKPGNWEDRIVSLFDANKKDFRPGHTFKPHPAARLVMTLFVNDCLSIIEGGRQKILRVQKLSHRSIVLAEHNEANTRKRADDKSFRLIRKSGSSLRKLGARKVHISPTGRIRYEG